MVEKTQIEPLLKLGLNAKQIATVFGCSHQRIYQIISDLNLHHVCREMREAKRKDRALSELAKWSTKHGLPRELWNVLRANGALRAYQSQRNNAATRGIEWLFTIETWWEIWDKSGMWDSRGRTGDGYVMARFFDQGPYSPSNVYICTLRENSTDYQQVNKKLRMAA